MIMLPPRKIKMPVPPKPPAQASREEVFFTHVAEKYWAHDDTYRVVALGDVQVMGEAFTVGRKVRVTIKIETV